MTYAKRTKPRKHTRWKPINWTDELKSSIINLYQSGLNCGRVAMQVGISESSVQEFITGERVRGVPLRDAPHGGVRKEV